MDQLKVAVPAAAAGAGLVYLLNRSKAEFCPKVPEKPVLPTTGTVEFGCFCGAVKCEFSLPTIFAGHCHCSVCRRISGAGYVSWIAVNKSQVKILQGEDHLHTFYSSPTGYRRSCKECMTPIFCDDDTVHPEFNDINFATVYEPDKLDRWPHDHWFWTDRCCWASVDPNDGIPRAETDPKASPGKMAGGIRAGKCSQTGK